jgi:kynurenine 3-monooxygenase
VTFSNIPYSVAYEQGKKQRLIMDEIMASPNIEQDWDSPQIMETILEQCSSFNFQT